MFFFKDKKRGFVNNGFSFLVSFFISLLLLFSFDYIANSDAAFCKDVKYKDDV